MSLKASETLHSGTSEAASASRGFLQLGDVRDLLERGMRNFFDHELRDAVAHGNLERLLTKVDQYHSQLASVGAITYSCEALYTLLYC